MIKVGECMKKRVVSLKEGVTGELPGGSGKFNILLWSRKKVEGKAEGGLQILTKERRGL
jgi:hypothetical protein